MSLGFTFLLAFASPLILALANWEWRSTSAQGFHREALSFTTKRNNQRLDVVEQGLVQILPDLLLPNNMLQACLHNHVDVQRDPIHLNSELAEGSPVIADPRQDYAPLNARGILEYFQLHTLQG